MDAFKKIAPLGALVLALVSPLTIKAEWTEVEIPGDSQRPQDMTYFSGLFIAVGYGGEIITSTDGVTWSLADVDVEPVNDFLPAFRSVAASDSMLVAVGDNSVVATSSNGTEWTVTQQGMGFGGYSDIAYGNGIFVATDYTDSISYSTDGASWESEQVNIFSITFSKVVFFNGEFVLFQSASANDVAVSTDAISWSWEAAGIDGYYTNSAQVVGEQIFVGSYDLLGTAFFVATDSTSFTQSSISGEVIGYINGFAGGQGVIASVGGNYDDPTLGYVLVSSDGGANYTIDTDELPNVANDIVYANGLWVIIGDGYAAYTDSISGGGGSTPYLVEGGIDRGDGWYTTWIGDINVNSWPWVYSANGWFYAGASGNSNNASWFFFTDAKLACWLWTSENSGPWVYGQPTGQAKGWWYVDGESVPGYTYLFSSTGAYIAIEDLF